MIKETNEKNKSNVGNVFIGLLLIILVIAIPTGIAYLVSHENIMQATMDDIDGYWNSSLTTIEYVFVPKHNIKSLRFEITICDKNKNELQTIYKTIGNVKKGQQYTVTVSIYEIDSLSTLWDSRYTGISIYSGTKSIF